MITHQEEIIDKLKDGIKDEIIEKTPKKKYRTATITYVVEPSSVIRDYIDKISYIKPCSKSDNTFLRDELKALGKGKTGKRTRYRFKITFYSPIDNSELGSRQFMTIGDIAKYFDVPHTVISRYLNPKLDTKTKKYHILRFTKIETLEYKKYKEPFPKQIPVKKVREDI